MPMNMTATPNAILARVNGVALHRADEHPDAEALRQRACTELLRQRAQQDGLLDADDAPDADGVISAAATDAIERLLDAELDVPQPTEAACRRYHAVTGSLNTRGERARLRHILFAVTPGVDVQALGHRAERVLMEVRCADDGGKTFAEAAGKWSNCPSGQNGGELGWLTSEDCAPEFAREIFGKHEVGVVSRLVHSRFGLHVVEICERDPGRAVEFEEVQTSVAQQLYQQSWVNAMCQYLKLLAGVAEIEGVELEGASSPLVQ